MIKYINLLKISPLIFGLIFLSGCATNPPSKTHNNLCHIYDFDDDWQDAARDSAKKWGTPEYILMAFVHQESRFVHNAQPPRPYFLGFIPLPRKSSAYGYPQAQDPAWYDYKKAGGSRFASRSDIEDSLDFIGWYNYQSYKRNGISRHDAFNLYLAYHEGNGGFSRQTYKKKPWLIKVARKVERKAASYKKQLKNCGKYNRLKATPTKSKTSKPKPSKNNNCNAPWPFC